MALTTMYEGMNNSPQTDITAAITASDTVIPVSSVSVFPAAPNLATLGSDENAEVIRYNGISGNTLTGCERGFGGTTASPWTAATVISRQITKYDLDTLRGNVLDLDTRKANADDVYSQSEVDTLLAAKADQTDLAGKANISEVASEFSATTAYAIDDLVIYQGSLYRFTSAHSAGAWNSSHVTACTVAEVIQHFGKFRISGTVSSGNMTLTDARIDSEHWRVPNGGIYYAAPSNVTSETNWSTDIVNHTITLSATYTAATNVVVELEWMQN